MKIFCLDDDLSSELSDCSTTKFSLRKSSPPPYLDLHDSSPLDPIAPISLSQDILTSDEETLFSPADTFSIGQTLFAYLKKDKLYAPAKLLRMTGTHYHVRLFDGRERNLKRNEILLPGDAQFHHFDCVTLPTFTVNPTYSNPVLETCMKSIYTILDNIIQGLHPSWRYQQFLQSTGNKLTWNLGSQRGGNPYSDNEYAFIKRLLTHRYCKDNTTYLGSDLLSSKPDRFTSSKTLTNEMKASVRLLDLVIVPECMLRLLLVSHLIVPSKNQDPEQPVQVRDLERWHRTYIYGFECWSKEKVKFYSPYYPLTLKQETKEIMDKAETLLKESNWVHALLSLKESSQARKKT
ncbi:hypothetical protein HMI55_005555 [Coelomomyces lativittatus]|nr:hypothetical protein HMI55_005555 [Coelomomyces lativittatus]